MSDKIRMTTPLVEMDGDEMTRILWKWIKEILIEPYVDLKTEYYDLGLPERDKTDDKVTEDAAYAAKKYGVAVKCATITPNAQRVEEYKLKQMWKSPNGTDKDGNEVSRRLIKQFSGDGIVQGVHNLDKSIRSFAVSCFNYALENKIPLWFGAKDTISKTYDHRFKDIFNDIYERDYKEKFEEAGIYFMYTLIDDIVARIVRSEGGVLWACKNYDGDVMSDMVATAYGSLGMMSSVLVSPEGNYEYEAAHGTVTRHYYKYLKGEETSTNSVATIWAWTGALCKRGELDGIPELCEFAKNVERAVIETIESGEMTGDLIPLFKRDGITPKKLESREFLQAVASRI